jgi:hypothetical protein
MNPDLVDLLSDIAEELDRYSDVLDGDYGEPRPNWAMRLRQRIDDAIVSLEGK